MIVGLGVIAAVIIFLWLKNKQENRSIDRKNRLAEKQDELIEMLREKNKNEKEDESRF
jgi:hypothetical protein